MQACRRRRSTKLRFWHASVELLVCDIETAHVNELIRVTRREAALTSSESFDLLDQLAAPMRAVGIKVKARATYGKSLRDSLLDVVTNKSPDVVRIYLPPDASCLLSVADHCLRS